MDELLRNNKPSFERLFKKYMDTPSKKEEFAKFGFSGLTILDLKQMLDDSEV